MANQSPQWGDQLVKHRKTNTLYKTSDNTDTKMTSFSTGVLQVSL